MSSGEALGQQPSSEGSAAPVPGLSHGSGAATCGRGSPAPTVGLCTLI